MKIAVKGAAKFFIEHVKSNSVPYALFKSILERQIEWAAKRGRNITFQDLAEAVRAELLKSNIYVMSKNDSKQENQRHSAAAVDEKSTTEIISPLDIDLKAGINSASNIFFWLHSVFEKANAKNYSRLRISVKAFTEAQHDV